MYSKARSWPLLALLTIIVALAVACGPTPTVPPVGTPAPTPAPFVNVLRFNSGFGDIPTIDPALTTDTSSVRIVEETTVGLTRLNSETLELEPGMATSWDISEDGTVYTFHLMEGVPWVRYNPASGQVEQVLDENGNVRFVTAHDFVYGILRTLDANTGSNYAYVLTTIIKGSADYNSPPEGADVEALKAAVAVQAIDDYTLEITINEPAGFAGNILGMWVAHAQPQWIIFEKGDRWTETGFQQSHGPYTLKEWRHDSDLTLIANPFWPGTDSVPQAQIDEIVFTMLDDTPGLAAYEAGELDVLENVSLGDLDRIRADSVLSQELNIGPVLCTYYYGYNTTKAPFDDARVRLAFSLAIDRQALIDNVTKGGQEPARWFTRPGLNAAPTPGEFPDLGVSYDPERAAQLLQEYLDEKGITVAGLPPITLMANQVEGHVRIAEAIQQMWRDVLGVQVQFTAQEWRVYLETLQEDPPQIWRLGWCQDYPDANNFAKEVFRSDSQQNHTRWVNPEYDRLVDEAARLTDAEARKELYVQAEDILIVQDAAIAPIYWYTDLSLTKPYVSRIFPVTGEGEEHLEKWSLEPH